MHIFLARDNVQAGPYSLEQVNQMLANGQVLLTDLMWHEGMNDWQRVGNMTREQFIYRPDFTVNDEPNLNNDQTNGQNADTTTNDHIITVIPKRDKAPEPKDSATNDNNVWDRYRANNPHHSDKKTIKLTKQTRLSLAKSQPGFDISKAKKQLDLAPVSSRILAKLIDAVLLILASLPSFLALYHSPNYSKLMAWAEAGQIYLTTAQQTELLSAIPQHIIVLTNILVWGLIFAQVILLMRRGQTLGKMIMGIRILDIRSNAVPTFFNLIFTRTFLTMIGYSLSVVGIVILAIDLMMMLTNKEHLSLHDRIAKTYVVRADDTQTTPLELKAD